MRSFGVLVCLIILALTGYSAIVFKAPKIEADIQARVEQALANESTVPIEVIVDGRKVTLRGSVSDDSQQKELLRRASDVWGALGPIDQLQRLTVISPYRFEATKSENGDVAVRGFAPDIEARDLITADAKAIFGADSEVRIDLAAGAPDGDWRGIAGLGMDALATLNHGEIVIADTDVSLKGNLANSADHETIEIFADAAPESFVWTNDLSVFNQETVPSETSLSKAAEPVEPFTFSIEKEIGGNLNISGYAPDENTRNAMIDQAKEVAKEHPVVADIQIADGMPNANWPELVFAGIGAMAQIEEGRYEVVGTDVSFTGDVVEEHEPSTASNPKADREDEPSQKDVLVDTDAAEALDDVDQTPSTSSYAMTIYKADNGEFWAEGIVPDVETRDRLLSALKTNFVIDDIKAEIEFANGVPSEDWQEFVVDRAWALKVVKSGSLSFEDRNIHLIGVVDTPEDIDTAKTKLTAIDNTMTVELNPIDPRPASKIELVVSSKNGVTLWGNFPSDLTEKDVVSALKLQDYQGGLVGGGRGNAEEWRRSLAGIGGYLPQFENVGITLTDDQPRISGKLYPNGDVDQVTEGLTKLFNNEQEPTIDISITELTYENDTKRTNPLTGKEEVYDRGYWLPIATFSAGLEECQDQSSKILNKDKILFLRGKSTLDSRAQKVIDDLAAVVTNCRRVSSRDWRPYRFTRCNGHE